MKDFLEMTLLSLTLQKIMCVTLWVEREPAYIYICIYPRFNLVCPLSILVQLELGFTSIKAILIQLGFLLIKVNVN